VIVVRLPMVSTLAGLLCAIGPVWLLFGMVVACVYWLAVLLVVVGVGVAAMLPDGESGSDEVG